MSVDGYVHFEAKDFDNCVRRGVARIGLCWHWTQIRQSILECPFEVQCGGLQQHGFCFFWPVAHRGHVELDTKGTVTLLFFDKDTCKGKHVGKYSIATYLHNKEFYYARSL